MVITMIMIELRQQAKVKIEKCNHYRAIGPMGHWAIGPLGHWAIGPLGHWAIGPLGHWAIGPTAVKIRTNETEASYFIL